MTYLPMSQSITMKSHIKKKKITMFAGYILLNHHLYCLNPIPHMRTMVLAYLPTKLGHKNGVNVANVGIHIPAPWVADGFNRHF